MRTGNRGMTWAWVLLAALAVAAAGPRWCRAQGTSDAGAGAAVEPAAGEEAEKEEELPPPRHGIERADEREKKIYDFVKARMLPLGAEQVTSIAGQAGFGERVGWIVAPMLETLVWGYRYSGDVAWLDRFAVIMTALDKALTPDPDGALGWHSAAGGRKFGETWPPAWPDASLVTAWQQSEALVVAACAEFAMTVRDDPELREKFGDRAEAWIERLRTKVVPKWESRCFVSLSDDRAVFTWPARVFKRSTMTWEPYPGMPNEGAGLTLTHPAQSQIILQYLALWRLTGKDDYRARAARLLRWQKSCLRFYRKGRPPRPGREDKRPADKSVYWWNYWDPAQDTDFMPEGGLAFGMYLSLEPMHYARDAEALVQGYLCGVVIDRDDIKRLVQTQLVKMLSGGAGDDEKPVWKDPLGQKRGMIWPHLAEFDDRLGGLLDASLSARMNEFGSKLRFMQERYAWGDWKRRYLGEARVILCSKTYEDFAEAMTDLIEAHPPPDPSGRTTRPRRPMPGF